MKMVLLDGRGVENIASKFISKIDKVIVLMWDKYKV